MVSVSDPGSERILLDQTRQQLLMTVEHLSELQGRLDQVPLLPDGAGEADEETGR